MLYEATVEMTLFILADTPEEARFYLPEAFREELNNLSCHDAEMREAVDIPVSWENANPYGKDTHLTVGEIFARIKEQRKQMADYQEYLKRQHNLFEREEEQP